MIKTCHVCGEPEDGKHLMGRKIPAPPMILEVPCFGCDKPILVYDSEGALTFEHQFENEVCEEVWEAVIEATAILVLLYFIWRLSVQRKWERNVVTIVEITGKDPRSCLMLLER